LAMHNGRTSMGVDRKIYFGSRDFLHLRVLHLRLLRVHFNELEGLTDSARPNSTKWIRLL